MKSEIAIIGGGPLGISALYQLVYRLSRDGIKDCSITVYEKTEVGPGIPYSTTLNKHILNLPAQIMSVVLEDPEHFARWLRNENIQRGLIALGYTPEELTADFPPRKVFGIYLKAFFDSIVQQAASNGINVNFVYGEVSDIKKDGDYKIALKNNHRFFSADKIILTIGHLTSDTYRNFINQPGYIHSSWNPADLQALKNRTEPVVILGTRLTAIDTALTLLSSALNYQGKIYLVSRLGLLPAVLGKTNSYDLQFLTISNLDKFKQADGYVPLEVVVDLLKMEIGASRTKKLTDEQWQKILEPTIFAHEYLKHEISEVETGLSRSWQSILFAVYPMAPDIWKRLSLTDKKVFFEKYYSVWMTYLAAFPLQNAKIISEYMQQGKIEVISGLQAVSYDSETGMYNITIQNHEIPKNIQAPFLVNATGPGYNITTTDSTLLHNLQKNGLIASHPRGGIIIDHETFQPIVNQANVPSIYVAGEMLRGEKLMTTDLGVACRHTANIASQIVDEHKASLDLSGNPVAANQSLLLYNIKALSPKRSNDTRASLPTKPSSSQPTNIKTPGIPIRMQTTAEPGDRSLPSAASYIIRKGFSISPPAPAVGLQQGLPPVHHASFPDSSGSSSSGYSLSSPSPPSSPNVSPVASPPHSPPGQRFASQQTYNVS